MVNQPNEKYDTWADKNNPLRFSDVEGRHKYKKKQSMDIAWISEKYRQP